MFSNLVLVVCCSLWGGAFDVAFAGLKLGAVRMMPAQPAPLPVADVTQQPPALLASSARRIIAPTASVDRTSQVASSSVSVAASYPGFAQRLPPSVAATERPVESVEPLHSQVHLPTVLFLGVFAWRPHCTPLCRRNRTKIQSKHL